MKKSRLQELAGIAKPTLNEGYAWEREENGALPTLASSTAKHAANQQASVQETTSLKEAKSNIKTTWKTMEDIEGDLQDWLGGKSVSETQQVLDTLQNFVDNYEGDMDMEDDF